MERAKKPGKENTGCQLGSRVIFTSQASDEDLQPGLPRLFGARGGKQHRSYRTALLSFNLPANLPPSSPLLFEAIGLLPWEMRWALGSFITVPAWWTPAQGWILARPLCSQLLELDEAHAFTSGTALAGLRRLPCLLSPSDVGLPSWRGKR